MEGGTAVKQIKKNQSFESTDGRFRAEFNYGTGDKVGHISISDSYGAFDANNLGVQVSCFNEFFQFIQDLKKQAEMDNGDSY